MKKQVYEITKYGFVKEIYLAEVNEHGIIIDEDKINFVSVSPPHGLFKAKWTGTKWIEGATQEEIDELTKVEPQPPTEIELLKQRLLIAENTILDLILGGL